MARKRMKYSQRSGALQEAMVSPKTHAQRLDSPLPQLANVGAVQVAAERPGSSPSSRSAAPLQGGLVHGSWSTTVREGARALVTEKGGQMSIVDGPAQIWRWGRTIEPMKQYVAHPGDFLVVRHRL